MVCERFNKPCNVEVTKTEMIENKSIKETINPGVSSFSSTGTMRSS